jgi:hypothetical protein
MVTFFLDWHHRIGFLGAKEAILRDDLGPEGPRRLHAGTTLHVITHFDGSQSSWRPLSQVLVDQCLQNTRQPVTTSVQGVSSSQLEFCTRPVSDRCEIVSTPSRITAKSLEKKEARDGKKRMERRSGERSDR